MKFKFHEAPIPGKVHVDLVVPGGTFGLAIGATHVRLFNGRLCGKNLKFVKSLVKKLNCSAKLWLYGSWHTIY